MFFFLFSSSSGLGATAGGSTTNILRLGEENKGHQMLVKMGEYSLCVFFFLIIQSHEVFFCLFCFYKFSCRDKKYIIIGDV